MNKWEDTYKQMLTEQGELEGEPQNTEEPTGEPEGQPEVLVDEVDDPLWNIATALILVLNDKDEGKVDEDAQQFLSIISNLSEKFKGRFPSLLKAATIEDDKEKGASVVKIQQTLRKLYTALKDAKGEEEQEQQNAPEGNSGEQQ